MVFGCDSIGLLELSGNEAFMIKSVSTWVMRCIGSTTVTVAAVAVVIVVVADVTCCFSVLSMILGIVVDLSVHLPSCIRLTSAGIVLRSFCCESLVSRTEEICFVDMLLLILSVKLQVSKDFSIVLELTLLS